MKVYNKHGTYIKMAPNQSFFRCFTKSNKFKVRKDPPLKLFAGDSVLERRLARHSTGNDDVSCARYNTSYTVATKYKRQTSEEKTKPRSAYHVPIFADSPPSSVEVKKGWSYNSTPPMYLPGTTLSPNLIHIYIQGVPGGKDLTSGECSLGQTIPI